jgi:hemin uptake protein HemP
VNNAVPQRPAASVDRAAQSGEIRTITSRQLLGSERVLIILHGRDEYRLQVTGSGKLILTK